MPTCLPSSHTLPWCPRHPTCTQAWQGAWATWVLSTSPSTIQLISTQSRVSWSQWCLDGIVISGCYLFVLSTLFAESSCIIKAWVKLFSLSVLGGLPQYCPVYLYVLLIVTCEFAIFGLLLCLSCTPVSIRTNSQVLPFCSLSLCRFSLPTWTPTVCSQRWQN